MPPELEGEHAVDLRGWVHDGHLAVTGDFELHQEPLRGHGGRSPAEDQVDLADRDAVAVGER